MTYQAGSASVSIVPEFEDFHSKIREELTALDAQFAEAGDKSGKSFAGTFQAQLKASFADLPNATVKADADTAKLDAELGEAARSRTATVKADADTTEATAKLEALTKKSWTVKVKTVADNVSGKTGTLADLLNPIALGAAATVALGPQALGLTAGIAGLGAGFAAAAADAGAFGVIAKGMFGDVTTAQKNLTTATAAYNKATTDAGRAKALADEQKALAGLTPAEKDLATQLTALEGAWKKLSQAEQPVVGAAITPWLQTATSGMRLLKPLIEDGAGAVRLLGTEAQTALQAPFWGTFFNTVGTTGQIALTDFGQAAGHVADGLAHLFVTFAPDIDNILPLVDRAARAFDHWASSVTGKGLNDFFSKTFSPANVHALAADGKELASFIENVAKASQDMSPLAFGGLSSILTILGSLSPGEVEALTGLFLAIKTVGTLSSAVSAVSGIVGKVKGLLGGAATAGETAAEGTAAGDAGGAAAAAAFTTAFSTGLTTSLPTAFTAIGTEVAAAADAAGTVWGTAAAATFGTSFGTESAAALTASFTAEDAAFTAEAAAAGTAMGTAMAAALTASFDAEGVAELGSSLAAGAAGAAIAAALAGAAIGAALGLGFSIALGATGIGGAVGKIENDVKSGAASAGTWLQPAGQQAADGFATGFLSQASRVQSAAAQAKAWTQAGAAGSGSWIQPHGQQAGQGFGLGFASAHAFVSSTVAQLRAWVNSALPSPASWLANAGISVMQGFANGIISGAGIVYSAASSIANSVISTISNALKIGSPSKVTHGLGEFTGQGFGLGLLSQVPYVGQSAGTLAVASVQGLAGAANAQSLSALGSLGVPSLGGAARLPGVSSPLGGGQLQMAVTYAGPSNGAIAAIVQDLQFHIQGTTGGDVQAALGRGAVRT